VYFTLVGEISGVEPIAEGSGIRLLANLVEVYGHGHWRKLKGVAWVRLADDSLIRAELHWYEAHGIGRKRLKIKRFLDDR
jgi:hypothetical protein